MVWLGCCSQFAHSVGSSKALTAALCCCASPLAFGSLSPTVSLLLLFICIYAPLFSLSSFPTSPRISQALNGSLSPFLSHSHRPSHSFSLVSQWVPGRASLEWPCGVMSSWSRVRKPGIQHPPHHPPLTPMKHTRTKKKKTTQLSHAQPTKRNSIGEAGQRGRGADEKSLEKLLQALINNYQTSKIK